MFGVAVSSLAGVEELPRREKDRLALFVEEERELECEAGAAGDSGRRQTVTAASSS
jgi:hypothetical protein